MRRAIIAAALLGALLLPLVAWAAFEALIPGSNSQNETGSFQALVPGGVFLNETVSAAAGGGGAVFFRSFP